MGWGWKSPNRFQKVAIPCQRRTIQTCRCPNPKRGTNFDQKTSVDCAFYRIFVACFTAFTIPLDCAFFGWVGGSFCYNSSQFFLFYGTAFSDH